LELVNYINKVIFDKFIQTPLYYHDNGNHAVVISPRNLHLRHLTSLLIVVSIMSYCI